MSQELMSKLFNEGELDLKLIPNCDLIALSKDLVGQGIGIDLKRDVLYLK